LLPEQLAIIAALPCYVLMLVIALAVPDRRGTTSSSGLLLLAAATVLAAGIALRWERLGQGPFLTLFEVLLSNLFSLTLVMALLYTAIRRVRPALPVTAALLILLAAWALATRTDHLSLPPTFDHAWLWIHVISGKLFLSLCMAAASLAVLLLLNRDRTDAVGRVAVASHDPLLWRLMAAAFVFHSFMLIAGAVWAHDAWGRYWSWDPLETWSLLTWLSLAIVLHLRLTFRVPPPLGWALAIGVFVIAFLTFFGVPFVSTAPHKGAM